MTSLDLGERQECLLTYAMREKPFTFDDLGLVALPTAISCARLFAQYTLERWHAPASVVADAAIVAAELVKLSVQDAKQLSEVRVRLFAFRQYVGIEVWDAATEAVPVTAHVGEKPQGIDLVDILARRWTYGMYGNTRITWAEVAVFEQTASRSSGVQLSPSS